jgi:hypothetical protein
MGLACLTERSELFLAGGAAKSAILPRLSGDDSALDPVHAGHHVVENLHDLLANASR